MKSIRQFKDKYKEERVFIIGNGPSLIQTPLEHLNDEYTIAMNKINHIYDKTPWRPSFYYFANSPGHSFSTQISKNCSLGIPCFINSEHENIIQQYENAIGFDSFDLLKTDILDSMSKEEIRNMPLDQMLEFWSDNIEYHLYHYHTMYGACQLAVYLGFNEIYFIGCDLGQEYQNPHIIYDSGLDPERYDGGKLSYIEESIKNVSWKSLVNGLMHQSIKKSISIGASMEHFNKTTNDHFVSDYLNDRRIHDGPLSDTQITKGHIITQKVCENRDVETYNATIGGKLDVYPRKNIKDIIQDDT
jgi:hypothetical protein